MATQLLYKVQTIPCALNKAWEFFSDPINLRFITPDYLDLEMIAGNRPAPMYPGQLIQYRIRPLLGISMYWMTEITHVEHQKLFVDEQRFGPYQFWHHEHHFRETDSGIEMTDIVHWRAPFGFVGNIANGLFLRRQVEELFACRFEKVEAIFSKAAIINPAGNSTE